MYNTSEFTAANLLVNVTGDPFLVLRHLLHKELYSKPFPGLVTGAKVFTGFYACCFVCTVALVAVHVFVHRDRQLYKVVETANGRLIVPHIAPQFLLANLLFIPLIFPYAWFACLRTSGDLTNSPLWFCLIWVPLFWGAWHVCWGTVAGAALLHASSKQSTNGESTKLAGGVPASVCNAYFICVLFTGCVAEIGISIAATLKYNRGIRSFNTLDKALALAQLMNAGAPGGSSSVLSAVPDTDVLLQGIAKAIYKFELRKGVCITFAILAVVTMFSASFSQIKTLRGQIKLLRRSIGNLRASSQDGTSFQPVSLTLNFTADTERCEGLIRTLRNIIFTSVALCFSMLSFLSACVVGQLDFNSTPILHRFKTSTGHLFVIFFVYAVVDGIVLSLIARQTFNPASQSSKPGQSERTGSSLGSSKRFALSLPPSYPGSPVSARFGEKEMEMDGLHFKDTSTPFAP